MADHDAPPKRSRAEVDALLKKQDWRRIHAELLAFAIRRTKSRVHAEDLVQEALRRVLDANWEPWDPEKNPSLLHFLTGIVNRNLSNDRTHSRVHRELAMDREAAVGSKLRKVADEADEVAVDASLLEDRTIAGELCVRRMDRLRADVASDGVVSAIVEQNVEGVEAPRELVIATGYAIEVIREGQRRLARHVARVTREIPAEVEGSPSPAAGDRRGARPKKQETT
jgi:DNA-directed RNA polymerase specialized sigma24 family protein